MLNLFTYRKPITRTLICVGTASFVSIASAFTPDPELGWGTTRHVDFSLITYALDRQPCMRSEAGFLGCVNLVNAMGSFARPPVALVPAASPERATVLRDFGALVFAQLRDTGELPPLGPLRQQELTRRQAQLREAALVAYRAQRERILGHGSVAEIEFDLLARDLLGRRARGISEAFAIGYAANALLSTHDRYARLAVKSYERGLAADADRSFVGIGAQVREVPGDSRLQIYRVLEGSPAEIAGLRSMDVVRRVEDQDASGLKLNQLGVMLAQSENKPLSFVVERVAEPSSLSVRVRPRRLSMNNLEARLLTDFGPKVLYLKIGSFHDNQICAKVREAMTGQRESSALLEDVTPDIQGVVLDLRDNRGGFVDEAVCVAGLFVGPRRILLERNVNAAFGAAKPYTSGSPRLTHRPVTVLINDMTASAAEVVAGALQDYASSEFDARTIRIVGTRSFGKGTVQRTTDSQEFPELLKTETVANYYLPLDHSIHLTGLTPDLEVFRAPQPTLEDLMAVREADFLSLPPTPPAFAWAQRLGRRLEIQNASARCWRGRTEQAWAQMPGADYQLLKAQELSACPAGF